jgi:hypothetical protein
LENQLAFPGDPSDTVRNNNDPIRRMQRNNRLESWGWFPYGFLHDCTDNGEPFFTLITDGVNSYTMQQLFRGFRANVFTVRGLRQEILNRNNNRQANEMDLLLNGYGY